MTYPPYGPPAPMPVYGYAPPQQTGQDSRFMPLLIGWLAAFLMPIVYCILRYVFYGKDWVGILLIAGAVGPLFFGIQCILNFVALAIPKWCKDSLAVFWGGMLVWWGSATSKSSIPGWIPKRPWSILSTSPPWPHWRESPSSSLEWSWPP